MSATALHARRTTTATPSLTRRWIAQLRSTWLLRSSAVIVDVETTDLDGRICEISIIDTAGRVLLDTLVDPGCPIAAGAAAVHGITADEIAGAPSWEAIAPVVAWLLADRPVAAYNAPFDQGIITRELTRVGHSTKAMAAPWHCLMRARSSVEGRPWRALDGGHRALGDCLAALSVLEDLALVPTRRGSTSC